MAKLRVHRRGSVSTPQDSATHLLPRFGGDDPLKEPESVTRYRQFLAGPHVCVDTALKGSTRPPDERLVAPGEIDSGLLQNSTNRLLLQSWLPDGRDARALATLRNPAQARSLRQATSASYKSMSESVVCPDAALQPHSIRPTPRGFNEDAPDTLRAGREFGLLSPVLPNQDLSNSFMSSKSWLKVKETEGAPSPQANWLSHAAPTQAPDTARSAGSANWLTQSAPPEAPDTARSASSKGQPSHQGDHRDKDFSPFPLPLPFSDSHSFSSHTSQASSSRTHATSGSQLPSRARDTRHRYSRPPSRDGDKKHSKMLPPLPPTPQSFERSNESAFVPNSIEKKAVASEYELGVATDAAGSRKMLHMMREDAVTSDEGRSGGSGASTPDSPRSEFEDNPAFKDSMPDGFSDTLSTKGKPRTGTDGEQNLDHGAYKSAQLKGKATLPSNRGDKDDRALPPMHNASSNRQSVSKDKQHGSFPYSSTAALPSNNVPESQKDRAVEMNLRLNMEFQAAGQEGSVQRQNFIKDLKQDLADASGMGTSDFNILKISPGSVVVDMIATEKTAQEIRRQSLDPNSRLRSGKVTRFTDKITLSMPVQKRTHSSSSPAKPPMLEDSKAVRFPRLDLDTDGIDRKSLGSSRIPNVTEFSQCGGPGTSDENIVHLEKHQASKAAIVIREHLMNFRFSCGVIPETDRSARQRACYNLYFSPWKRTFVSLAVLLHMGLAFAELQFKSYTQHSDSLTWQSAGAWIQALHFLIVFVYIIDVVLMTIGLTSANLNPAQNARNPGFMLIVILIAADTLLTATKAETSSYSLPLRVFLLMSQIPGAVRMFQIWMSMVYVSFPILAGFFCVMVCFAVVAVIAIRDQCPFQGCNPDSPCENDTTDECKTLLRLYPGFPSALAILWNLAGSTGLADNQLPFLKTNAAFAMLYFFSSSAVCMLMFRFMWLAAICHGIRAMSLEIALAERRQIIQLLHSSILPTTMANKKVSVNSLANILSSLWPDLSVHQSSKLLQQIYGIDSIPKENVGALAWLLHADHSWGWMCHGYHAGEQFSEHKSDQEGALENALGTKTHIATIFLSFCSILSMGMMIASAWLPDPGIRCLVQAEAHAPLALVCVVNGAFECVDVVLCAVFCVELMWILVTQGLCAFVSLCNLYKFLEVVVEILMICTLFRNEGMGNKGMILRLFRAPRLLSIIHHPKRFNFYLEFVNVTLKACSQIFLMCLIFVFFFGTVLWGAVVFTTTRPDIGLDFGGLSSACFAVYLMLIGGDWHSHTNAIMQNLHSNSQLFGFVLLFVAQFIGGQILFYILITVAIESWKMCCKSYTALHTDHIAHTIRFKCKRNHEMQQGTLVLMPWVSATLLFGKNGLNFEVKSDEDHDGAITENKKQFCVAYTRICECRLLDHDPEKFGLDSATSTACVVLRAQDTVILIDATDFQMATSWVESIHALTRRARVEFSLDAAVPRNVDAMDFVHDYGHYPIFLLLKRYACVRRRCTAIDVLIHDFDEIPMSLTWWSNSNTHVNANPMQMIQQPPSESSTGLRLQPASCGYEMSCRTNTPRGTPTKLYHPSSPQTPLDQRARRESFVAASLAPESAAKDGMIAAVEMLKGLRPGDANALASEINVIFVHAGNTIIPEGQLGSFMIRILQGTATVCEARKVNNQRNPPLVLQTLERGMMYGDRDIFEDNASNAGNISVSADTDCKYVVLTKNALADLLVRRPSLCAKLKDNAAWLGIDTQWLLSFDRFSTLHVDTDVSERSENTERTDRSSANPRKIKQHASEYAKKQHEAAAKRVEQDASQNRQKEAECAKKIQENNTAHNKEEEGLSKVSSVNSAGDKGVPDQNDKVTIALLQSWALSGHSSDAQLHRSENVEDQVEMQAISKGHPDTHTPAEMMTVPPSHINSFTAVSVSPHPVYFSAGPAATAVKLATSSAGPLPEHLHATNHASGTSGIAKAVDRHRVPRDSKANDLRTSGKHGVAKDSSSASPRPASPKLQINEQAALGIFSPVTPAVNRENQPAYLNNNVVLPPGANVQLASKLHYPTTNHSSSLKNDEGDTNPQLEDSWT